MDWIFPAFLGFFGLLIGLVVLVIILGIRKSAKAPDGDRRALDLTAARTTDHMNTSTHHHDQF